MNISNTRNMGNTLIDYIYQSKDDKPMPRPATMVSIPMPNFDNIWSKAEPEMSEEDYKKAIIAQAQADAAGTGRRSRYMALKRSFVSVAAPDVKTTITDLVNRINQQLSGSGVVDYFEVTDPYGNKMASYDPGSGWTMFETPSMISRELEFNTIYRDAYNAALSSEEQNSQPQFQVTV